MLGCHARAERTGVAVSSACLANAKARFIGGPPVTKGCIELVGSKNSCASSGDASAIAADIDGFVEDVVTQLEAGAAGFVKRKCAAVKQACVSRAVLALLRCHASAARSGKPVDPICLMKAQARFDGGVTPAKGCFERIEAKGGCLTMDDTAPIAGDIDAFVDTIVCRLTSGSATCAEATPDAFATPTPTSTNPTPTRTPTPTLVKPTRTPKPTPTPAPSVCGNGRVEDGEDCDGDDLDGYTCDDFCAAEGGTLRCFANCGFDVSLCAGPFCEAP